MDFKLPSNGELVSWDRFDEVVSHLSKPGIYSFDTETTGTRVHHGDRMFSLIIDDGSRGFYFNFEAYNGLDEEFILDRTLIPLLKPIFANEDSKWYAHWARFDLHILANEGIAVAGEIHCTRAQGLIEYNEHQKYSLAACAERIGLSKDDAVEEYIKDHKLSSKADIPGKKQRATLKDFTRVPPRIIVPYGLRDARVGYQVGESQKARIRQLSEELPPLLRARADIWNVHENEKRLTKTIFDMERLGMKVDLDFTRRAIAHESKKLADTNAAFLELTGEEFSASPKLFARIFEDQKAKWKYTDKGNPSFSGDVIDTFKSPIADLVNTLRKSKSRLDFFNGFLYHIDADGIIHPILNQDGAGHGRFSGSDPNFQNLSSNDDEDAPLTDEEREFQVRRAITPRPGFFLVAIDYAQMEYRLVLDLAEELGLIRKIKDEGLDVHQAVANEASIKRGIAKNVNFGLIYGEGEALLAENLGVTRERARELKNLVLGAMPNVNDFNQGIMHVAKTRGFIINWYGRRCWFPPEQFAYRALNYAIAGGAADIVKIGMNRLADFLRDKKSRMIWNVHDELWFEIAHEERDIVPELKRIMMDAYPHRHLPMDGSIEWSEKSFGDLTEWTG